MKSRTRNVSHVAALLLSTALCGTLPGVAGAQTAGGDPTNPQTWKTPEYRAQWGLDFINAADAYAKGLDGSGVTVGVVDSGLDTDHPEFVGRYVEGITYDPSRPWNIDIDGHGTGVASVIAANRDGIGMHGVAPGATIAMASVGSDQSFFDGLGPLNGISQLVDRGVRIINNSYGSFLSITDTMDKEDKDYLAKSLPVYRRAVAAGTLLIWATMNDDWDQPSLEAGLPHLFPEFERGWLAVTAVGPGYSLDWANRCGVAKNWCLAAPGGGPGWKWDPSIGDYVWHGLADGIYIAKPDGGYEKTSGTSFAAPHVAGTAALVSQMFPYMTMEQVRQVLLGTATDIGAPGVDEIFGYGLLDAGKAVLGPGKFDWGDFHAVIDEGESWWENDITGDGGLIKSGNGVIILSGESTYLGDTRIDGGILVIGGSITSDTFVGAQGMLSGDGKIFGDVDNHGAVLGGWSRDGGTLTIDGNYRQRADSWLLVELGAPDGTSRLDVSGSATIEGGSVDIGFGPGGYKGDARHTIITAGSVTGQFEDICNCYAFLDFDLAYDPTNVYLDVARNSIAFADVANTRNGAAVAGGIESLGVNNPFYGIVTTLNEDEAAVAFNQLTGEVHASLAGTLVIQSNFINDAVSSRLRAAFAGADVPALPVMAYGPDGPELAPATTDRFAVWSQMLGAWGKRDGTDNAVGMDHSIGGVLVGGDAALGDAWRLGVLGGYSHTTFESRQTSSTGSSKNLHLGLYAGAEWGPVALRTGAAYTWNDIETRRAPRFSGYFYDFESEHSADYDAGTAQVFGELGYRMTAGNLRLEPFAGLAHASVKADGFAETGAGMSLVSAPSTTDVTFTTIGLHVATDFDLGNLAFTTRGMLGWRHALGDTIPTSMLALAGGTPFVIEGLPISRNALTIEAGLDFQVANTATFGFSYAGQLASKAQDHRFKVDLAVRF